ncbi:phosphoribosyltransferase family protein [Mangrovimonas sp. DI 80]|uniref:phosphoribosyltransferase family protein n=1 Tax=Mangrovimonas sp. DI 80 TaxID=1779330 RepID=UPI000976FF17|nr:phosphoribosyltransferase family protein [Mangrovimonas sp. DI 80]OMP31161.1 hypothetical protein BKM32_08860 [Mangrovimonas sp. DI 80]
MNYKSYADLTIDILQGLHKIPSNIQLVVGIPRSGMIPAYMIGTQLNLPVVALEEFLKGSSGMVGERNLGITDKDISHVLIVDDSVYSGTAIQKAKEKMEGCFNNHEITFCAIYSATEAIEHIDFYFKYLPQPRAFQWNYKNCFNVASQSCYDIDGVLCIDPTEEENDDASNYRHFLLNAKPLFIPKYKIPCLVTSRLEKYRKETETWLNHHQVEYGELIMLDLPSAKERRRLGIHASFKASIYEQRVESLFVESSWHQAKDIFKITNKPVFCTENDVFIKSMTDIVYHENTITYANRHIRDVFSEETELSLQMQQLRLEMAEVQKENQKALRAMKIFEENKWVQFSKLNKVGKIKFIGNLISSKLKTKNR